jgi:hypothetical protein
MAPEAPTKGCTSANFESRSAKNAAPRAVEIVEQELLATQALLHGGAQHPEAERIGQEVQQVGVDEHVREEGSTAG